MFALFAGGILPSDLVLNGKKRLFYRLLHPYFMSIIWLLSEHEDHFYPKTGHILASCPVFDKKMNMR